MHTIMIDQQFIEGVRRIFVIPPINKNSNKTCEHHVKSYSEKYDSYYCAICDIWADQICSNPHSCEFCKDKPDRPPQII